MASRGRDGLFFTWWISRTSAISELDGMAARGRGETKKWENVLEKERLARRKRKGDRRRGDVEQGER